MTDLTALTGVIARDNHERGWHDRWHSLTKIGDLEGLTDHAVAKLALIDTEVAEAIEEVRTHGICGGSLYYTIKDTNGVAHRVARVTDGSGADWAIEDGSITWTGVAAKPEGLASELADVVIRALDLAALLDIDLPSVIDLKLAYNRTRGHKHGGKTI